MPQTIFAFDSDIPPLVIPNPDAEVLPGVRWGECGSPFTPAYWRALLHQRCNETATYRIGETLQEEVAACVLGGHSLRSETGLAAFGALKNAGLLRPGIDEEQYFARLSLPLTVAGRPVRYRFARTKSRYLSAVASAFRDEVPPTEALTLRDWLLKIKGVGPKTAAWVVHNYHGCDEIAILDVHLVRAAQICGVFPPIVKLPAQYGLLERRFVEFSRALGVPASLLDACMWAQMKRNGSAQLSNLL
ncbi:Thermostable 8-oxoguanine DNA glycosylase [Candidatus Burkholderia humilis]|nr:Thermostable 8-oxoguanine DNA glycosylase [Candidatus Burkholderia humilis]